MSNRLGSGEAMNDAMTAALDELRRLAGPLFVAIERLGMAIVVTAPHLPDNPIVFVNPGFSTLTGYEPEDVLGRNCRLLQGPASDPAAIAAIGAAVKAGRRVDTKILNYRKDGVAFWNNLSITPVLDGNAGPAFFLAILIDGTAASHAISVERALQSNLRRLSEVNERLRIVLSISGAAAAWEWHIDERRIEGDAGFAALYGLKTEEAAAGVDPKTFFSIIHPDDKSRIRLAVGGMLYGAEVFSKEYRLLPADGSLRWVHARGRCHYDEHDKPKRFSGVLVDVTEQKRVEEQLRIAQTAGGIGTFEYIDGFGTVSVSKQFCGLLGLGAASVLPVRTINAVVSPGDPPIIDIFSSPSIGSATTTELRVIRPDTGEERWITRRGEYLRDAETAGIRFSGVVYDVTGAKRVEEQLRALNETLETRVEERTRERDRIWRVSRDLYVVCDGEGRCASANPAWQSELGYPADDIEGRPLFDFIHEDDRGLAISALGRLAPGQPVDNIDLRMLANDAEIRWFSWTFVSEGNIFSAAGRDITQRNQLEEQLRQSQKMEAVGQLTGGIAHDFNNLLTGITGSLDMVRRRLSEGHFESVDRLIDAAQTSAQRAASLTHRLLAFSRRQSLDVRALDVNRLVASMGDLLHRTLGEHITLSVSLEPNLWIAISDANQLESALLNLAINARDAMPDGGRLMIQTANAHLTAIDSRRHGDLVGDFVMILVSDTGTGMSHDVAAKAFDPFFTTKPIGQGTGLGLSMIYGFAKQSGGHVEIDSALGVGTTIKLYVPRFSGEIPREAAMSPVRPLPAARGETILVVEDDPSVRLLVLELLDDLGYQTIEAVDSRAALPVLQSSQRLDLMVSDVGLPGMSGRQLAEVARQHRPDLKILFITGYAETAAVRGDFLAGSMEMMLKPFAIDQFANKIRDMLR
jgi:PAS domain S-box-containing protein